MLQQQDYSDSEVPYEPADISDGHTSVQVAGGVLRVHDEGPADALARRQLQRGHDGAGEEAGPVQTAALLAKTLRTDLLHGLLLRSGDHVRLQEGPALLHPPELHSLHYHRCLLLGYQSLSLPLPLPLPLKFLENLKKTFRKIDSQFVHVFIT